MLLLQLSNRRQQSVNEDHDLDQEGFPEQIILELQVQQGIPREMLRVLPQDLGVIFVYVKEWL